MQFVMNKLGGILHRLSFDDDHGITKKEFIMMLHDAEATDALQEVGVDAIGLVDFVDIIFAPVDGEESQLSFHNFMEIILQFRGSNTATVKDLVESQRSIRIAIEKLGHFVMKLEDRFDSSGL